MGVDAQGLETLAQHLAALSEGRGGDALQNRRIAVERVWPWHQTDDRRGHLRRRREGARRHVEQDLGLGAPAGQHAKAAIGLRAGRCDDALGDLALEHQGHRVVPGRPRLGLEPTDQQRRRNVVGQVGDDARRRWGERRHIDGKRVVRHDRQAAGAGGGDFLQRGDAAIVALDGDNVPGAGGEQGAGEPAGAGADLDHGDAGKIAGGARDAGCEVEIEQEILAEVLLGAKLVTGDDLAERGKLVERAHCALSFRLSSAAKRSAAARLVGSARPLPAISSAVP